MLIGKLRLLLLFCARRSPYDGRGIATTPDFRSVEGVSRSAAKPGPDLLLLQTGSLVNLSRKVCFALLGILIVHDCLVV